MMFGVGSGGVRVDEVCVGSALDLILAVYNTPNPLSLTEQSSDS